MAKVIFNYNGTQIEYEIKEKFKNVKDICEEFCKDSQNNINNLVFLVGENLLNLDSDSQILGYKKYSNDPINISVFDKNCFCYTHKEPFDSYCEICKINLCNECKNKHNIILYEDIIPNIIIIFKQLIRYIFHILA